MDPVTYCEIQNARTLSGTVTVNCFIQAAAV